jgi:hypothetical protein
MAGLQNIIDKCNGLKINRRNVVGIQITRNEIPRTSFTPTKNPWRFTLDMPNSYRYSEARALMEELDRLDRYLPETITFSNNSKFSWMFAYQGAMSGAQISNITVSSFTGNQLVLTNLPAVSPTTVLFKANDLIQIGASNAYPFPFTSETEVLRGSLSTVTVTTHRPNILSGTLTGLGIIVGNACQFQMFCINMPVYKLIVGGMTGTVSAPTNNAIIEWSDVFELYEYVGNA